MVKATRWSLADILDAFDLDLDVEPVQLVPVSRVDESASAFPFESGMLPITPLAPLVVHAGEETDLMGSLESVAAALTPLHGPKAACRILTHDGVRRTSIDVAHSHGVVIAICVPAADPLQNGSDPRAMQQIVARLRRPDGCPWDRKQTYATLSKNLVDEVYEAVDAIDQGDVGNLAEELGDLYLLTLMLSQIAHEAGDFSIEEVYTGITRKIVGRHPHVFGDAVVESESDLVGVWAAAKAKEVSDSGKRGGKDIDGEPFSMPALTRATRVLNRHPLMDGDGSPEFLRLVAGILASGDDPDAVLREQLRNHAATSAPTITNNS